MSHNPAQNDENTASKGRKYEETKGERLVREAEEHGRRQEAALKAVEGITTTALEAGSLQVLIKAARAVEDTHRRYYPLGSPPLSSRIKDLTTALDNLTEVKPNP